MTILRPDCRCNPVATVRPKPLFLLGLIVLLQQSPALPTGDIDANDIESGGLTGSALVSEAGTVVVDHAIKADDLTEGDETMEISFYSDRDRTQQVGSTASSTIKDTSLTPKTYSVTQ